MTGVVDLFIWAWLLQVRISRYLPDARLIEKLYLNHIELVDEIVGEEERLARVKVLYLSSLKGRDLFRAQAEQKCDQVWH